MMEAKDTAIKSANECDAMMEAKDTAIKSANECDAMMEAKDTAIKSANECDAIPFKWVHPEAMYYIKRICEHQAAIIWPIAFKAGYEQSVLDNDNWAKADYGYKLGITEVVETYKRDNPSHYRKYQAYWEDLLKKLGGL